MAIGSLCLVFFSLIICSWAVRLAICLFGLLSCSSETDLKMYYQHTTNEWQQINWLNHVFLQIISENAHTQYRRWPIKSSLIILIEKMPHHFIETKKCEPTVCFDQCYLFFSWLNASGHHIWCILVWMSNCIGFVYANEREFNPHTTQIVLLRAFAFLVFEVG